MKTTLYSKDVSGSIRQWSIEIMSNGLEIVHGTLGGSMQSKVEHISMGKGARTLEEQIKSRFFSRVNAQFDKGYVETLEEAQTQKRTNSMGLLRPMLAKPLKDVKNIDYENAYYQHKYDGNRCLITCVDGKLITYTRNGKPFSTLAHITDSMKLPEGLTIDGELYCHGIPLLTIASWAKKLQPQTLNLDLRVYDTIADIPYSERLALLNSLELGRHAAVVPTLQLYLESDVDDLFSESIKHGYEGGIIRWGSFGYEDGKRSKSLVKVKTFFDDEYIVIDIHPSKDGWARLECETNDGVSFMVSAPGGIAERYKVMENKADHITKMVTVKYAYITKYGVPFHPVAVNWRSDL